MNAAVIQQVKHHLPRDHIHYNHLLPPLETTTRSGKTIFHGWNMAANFKVHFAKYAERLKSGVSLHKEVEVCGAQQEVERMKAHTRRASHLKQVEAQILVSRGETRARVHCGARGEFAPPLFD